MKNAPPFFIGWAADPPGSGRRVLLRAGLALAAGGAAGLAAVLARGNAELGATRWEGEARSLRGLLVAAPYPALRTRDLGGTVRTVFLASEGKSAAAFPAALVGQAIVATGSLIARGEHAMLAVAQLDAARGLDDTGLQAPAPVDEGEVLMAGEILDAKCWFGAMRPGFGKTHKACAALCARGGLPLAFCRSDACGAGLEAPLFVDATGSPHAPAILPWVADPVVVRGRLVRVGDVVQLRAGLQQIRRL
ncbi:hypothetical protein O4H66_23660 [Comamonadaceae bacterium G21597-S1]|nr:hypothetical protein [Comamonadaceae bacterium G21597-S1]